MANIISMVAGDHLGTHHHPAAFRRHATVAALTPRLGGTLAAGTLVGFLLASVFGAAQGSSLNPAVIDGEALVVVTFLTAAIFLAQRWSWSKHQLIGYGANGVTV